jgi:hypothetical protein
VLATAPVLLFNLNRRSKSDARSDLSPKHWK